MQVNDRFKFNPSDYSWPACKDLTGVGVIRSILEHSKELEVSWDSDGGYKVIEIVGSEQEWDEEHKCLNTH